MSKRFFTGMILALAAGAMCVYAPEARAGETVELAPSQAKQGEQFTVTLDANPTTGYSWQLDKTYDDTVVKLVGSEYKRGASGMVGSGGKQIWTFKAVGAGKT